MRPVDARPVEKIADGLVAPSAEGLVYRGSIPTQYLGTPAQMSIQQTITIRVRYPEVDGMGYLHHSRYLQYFEMGRVELLRQLGVSYADLERSGVFFVVVKAALN